MSTDGHGGSPEPSNDDGPRARRRAENDAWGAFGLMVSGVVVWGGAGYLLARWTGHELFTLGGLLLGMGAALYGVWFRYGRS
jgi:F0F1-type ATP synthase assembly protein I